MMDQRHFVLLIVTGVFPLVQSNYCKYILINQNATWTNAQAYCRATHKDLATIESDGDIIKLQTEAQSLQFGTSTWIGLYNDINSWRWSYRDEQLGTMRLWYLGQPNNSDGAEECGRINPLGWYDATCTFTHAFICFDETKIGNNRYILYSTPLTWYSAQAYCKLHHTDLASDRDDAEHSIIMGMITGHTWFGLYRDSWKWSDQTIVTNSILIPYKARYNYCAYVNISQVIATQCTVKMPFFCYKEITGKQKIIRVKIQTNQDVNDPLLEDVVSQKIQSELEDHGVENATVQFRIQPEGKVFHKLKEINITVNQTC